MGCCGKRWRRLTILREFSRKSKNEGVASGGRQVMKMRWVCIPLLFCSLFGSSAAAQNRVIVRTTLGLQGLQRFCNLGLFQPTCTVVRQLGDPQQQLFLVTTPLDLTTFLNLLGNVVGIVDAEADQLVSLIGGINQLGIPPAGLSDTAPNHYFNTNVWNGYAVQPAAQIVRVSEAQNEFHVSGAGIVADIDTGVDPNHPALKNVLLAGYDFTRNQPGGSEMNDFAGPPPSGSTSNIAQVNQSTAAVLDQSTAAVLDGNPQYAAFGHGTMVLGVVHLVAPRAKLMPLKAFDSSGSGFLSDILRAVYFGVQNGANVINMSFDFKTSSAEFNKAMDYANQNYVICASSAGNDGMQEIVYPAALQNDVMGVASTSDADTRSIFSNYGNAIVWVAAPGEAIISTYPFGTYAASSGTSFSAPFVSGAAALLLDLDKGINQSQAATSIANAVPLTDYGMGNGRLDLVLALQSMSMKQLN
jgi:subtilisin family serine protease